MYCKCCVEKIRQVGSHLTLARKNYRAGVTLTELVITVAIVCILACIALPDMRALASRKAMANQADQICGFLHQAREQAVREGINWRVHFIPEEGYCFAFGDANGNRLHDAEERMLGPCRLSRGIRFGCSAPKGPNNTAVPGDGISFVDNRICYSTSGTCNSGTLYLRTKERSMGLRVLPSTGTILMYQYINEWSLLR